MWAQEGSRCGWSEGPFCWARCAGCLCRACGVAEVNLRSRFVQTRVSAGTGTWDLSKEKPTDPGYKKSPPLPKDRGRG